MANQDFRRMTPGEVIHAIEKRVYRLEHGGAGAPNTFRRLVTFAPGPEAQPGIVIKAVTTPAIQEHDTQVIYGPDGETVLLRITNDGSVITAGRVDQTVPRFLVHKTGTQNYADADGNTFARLEFNLPVYDPFSVFDAGNHWFTVPADWAGTWAFSAAVAVETTDFGMIRVVLNTDPAGGTSFTSVRSEGTSYKPDLGGTTLTWVAAVPYTEVELVAGERGVIEAQTVLTLTGGSGAGNVVISTNAHTFFFGKWIHS